MKKIAILVLSLCLVLALAACGGSASSTPASTAPASTAPESTAPASTAEVSMQYISPEDLKADIEAGGEGYIILDVRKAADYAENHIQGAYSADVDPSISSENNETSTANLKAALSAATGSETGGADDQYVLVCYSGKKYAQAATGLLADMGVPAANIYTLEGGNTAWTEAGDDYTALMESGAN